MPNNDLVELSSHFRTHKPNAAVEYPPFHYPHERMSRLKSFISQERIKAYPLNFSFAVEYYVTERGELALLYVRDGKSYLKVRRSDSFMDDWYEERLFGEIRKLLAREASRR